MHTPVTSGSPFPRITRHPGHPAINFMSVIIFIHPTFHVSESYNMGCFCLPEPLLSVVVSLIHLFLLLNNALLNRYTIFLKVYLCIDEHLSYVLSCTLLNIPNHWFHNDIFHVCPYFDLFHSQLSSYHHLSLTGLLTLPSKP